jgi:hypothetical protein
MRFLRALVWLRWRLLANALKGSRRRDAVERFSRVLALLLGVLVFLVAGAAAVGLGWLAWWVGRQVGAGELPPGPPLLMARGLLLLILAIVVLAPLGRTLRGADSGGTRLLLLPIPRRTLHLVEVLAGLCDPWVVPVIPALLLLPAGLAAAGRATAAALALIAAAVLLFAVATVSALASFAMQWFLRERRRAEVATLIFFGFLSVAGMLPALVSQDLERSHSTGRSSFSPDEFDRELPWAARLLPTEIYGRAVRRGIDGRSAESLALSGALLAIGATFFALSSRLHRRLVESPEEGRTRHRPGARHFAPVRWVGLSGPAAAVAWTAVRTTLRTLRGKFLLFFAGPLVALVGLTLRRAHGGSFWQGFLGQHGYLLLTGASFMALTSAQPLLANLFAVDKAGLTLQFLAPIRDRDLLRGKLAGGGLLYGATLLLCLVGVALVAPGGSPLAWAAGWVGGASTYFTMAPLLAIVSILFPKAADLNKMGNPGNPHGLAALLVTLAALVACVPPSLILGLGYEVLNMPALTLLLMLLWMLLTGGLALLMTVPLAGLLATRRENLALLAQQR